MNDFSPLRRPRVDRIARWIGWLAALIAGCAAAFGNVQALAIAAALLVITAVTLSPRETLAAGTLAGLGAVVPILRNAYAVAPLSVSEWLSVVVFLAIWIGAPVLMSFARRVNIWILVPVALVCCVFVLGSVPSLRHKLYPVTRESVYVTMPDGVKIAADVYLPRGLTDDQRLPAVLRQIRYYRSVAFRWPFNIWIDNVPAILNTIVAQHRYAAIVTDVRGSGASFGSRAQEWSPKEVRDGSSVVDWIVAQPWSNGRVGAVGGSYDGASAEFLLSTRNPAVKAAIVMSAPFDTYTDLAFPGGLNLQSFTDQWTPSTRILDFNELPDVTAGWLGKLVLLGVNPVNDDWNALRAAIQAHHANYDGSAFIRSLEFRDDRSRSGLRIDAMSPARRIAAERAADVPTYSVSGWFDGAYQSAAIKRFINVHAPGSRLLLGPWDHSRAHMIDPLRKTPPYDLLAEMLRFFDCYLKGDRNGFAALPPVTYYTIGDGWHVAPTWPPPGIRLTRYYFDPNHALRRREAVRSLDAEYHVTGATRTGKTARWDSLTGPWTSYADRRREDAKLLVYQSPPLKADLDVTGSPIVTLRVRSSARDVAFFVYLEDVDEHGHVFYATEGELRAIDRRLSEAKPPFHMLVPYHSFLRRDARPLDPGHTESLVFGLLPVSWLFQSGHSIRVAIACADTDHFRAILPAPAMMRVYEGGDEASSIDLPVLHAQN